MKFKKVELKKRKFNVRKKKENEGNESYYYDFRYKGKRYFQLLGADKSEAEDECRKIELEVRSGTFNPQKKKKKRMKFKDMAQQYIESYSEPFKKPSSTVRDIVVMKHLNEYFGDMYLDQINIRLLGGYIDSRKKKGRASRTIDLEIMVMKNIFNKFIEWEEIEKNPISKHKFFNEDTSRVKHLTPEQLSRLYSKCCEHLLPVVIMAVNTGCRKGEILNLRWKNVDFAKKNIYITNTKSSKNRHVPMTDELEKVFLELTRKSLNEEYVFCYLSGEHIGKPLGDIKTAWNAACRRAGIKDFRFHDIRHHFACTMVSGGLDLISLKQLLGHSSTAMVERYANYVPDKNKKAIDILNAQMACIWRVSKKSKDKDNKEDK